MRYSHFFSCFLATAQACGGLYQRQSGNATASSAVTRIKPPLPTSKFAITNVRIFDGYKINEPSTAYVDGTKISEELETVDYVVEGNGGILLPGLMDSHNHAASIEDLETLSSYGITTTFVMNCMDYELCSSLRYQTGMTSVYFAGLSAKGPNSSHAINAHAPMSQLIWSPSQAEQYVANVIGNGSDYLKIVSEAHGPDQATQNALVTYAHAAGLKVMTHAADLASYVMAILSKSDGPQHIPLDAVLNASSLELMYANKQSATPTMAVFYRALHIPGAGATLGHADATFESAWPILKQNVAALKKAGIAVLAGTDATPPYAGVSIPFGTTLHDELYYLVEAGLSTVDALRSATLMPALSHGLHDRGRIEPDYRADLVLLQPDADPLKSINDTRKMARVWNGGIEYTGVREGKMM